MLSRKIKMTFLSLKNTIDWNLIFFVVYKPKSVLRVLALKLYCTVYKLFKIVLRLIAYYF